MKRLYLCVLLFLALAVYLPAGDSASFVNLGFSGDSRYFCFGQYGLTADETKPYADLFLVDVKKNTFVRNGTVSRVFDTPIEAGQDGFGAFLKLFMQETGLLKEYNIDFLTTGRLVYILINGAEPKATLEFRDFEREKRFVVTLHQDKFGEGADVSASFFIALKVTDKNGQARDYTIGLPSYKRPGVLRYRINKVFFSPDETSLVFVVEKETLDGDGVNIRYMVETIPIQ
ncbi:MAG: DUF2259 domain-containing protein [Spirochaetales bacterium]|nr:DUF2259 domain-containing protein [Spirochaetales bacterium]